MFLPVCTVYVCMSLCFLCFFFFFFFFFYGPFGVPELKCTYLLTYLLITSLANLALISIKPTTFVGASSAKFTLKMH